jgi:replicative DNA helicase
MSLDFEALGSYPGPDRVVHFTDYLAAVAKIGSSVQRFQCGFEKFNQKIEGLETGEVAVVTGYTKNGKTLFAESWLRSMTLANPAMCPVIFSFELQPQKLLAKYQADPQHPVFLPLQLKTMSFDWLLERCLEAKLKHHAQAILIDHLHFLVDMNTRQNMSLNIGAFMRSLKHEIAKGLNMAVILIAHQGQPKENQRANLGGLRDSSFIAQESDMVIVVSRKQDLSPVEMKDYEIQGLPYVKLEKLKRPIEADPDDRYSTGLAIVEVSVARRSGAYQWEKLFKKVGNWVEEI